MKTKEIVKTEEIEDTYPEMSWQKFLEVIRKAGFEIVFEEVVSYRAPYGTIYWRTPWTDSSYGWKICEGEDPINLTVFIAICNEKKLLLSGTFWPEREGTDLGIFAHVSGYLLPFRKIHYEKFGRTLSSCGCSFSLGQPRFRIFRKVKATSFSCNIDQGLIKILWELAKIGKFISSKDPTIHSLPLSYYYKMSEEERKAKAKEMLQTLPRWA